MSVSRSEDFLADVERQFEWYAANAGWRWPIATWTRWRRRAVCSSNIPNLVPGTDSGTRATSVQPPSMFNTDTPARSTYSDRSRSGISSPFTYSGFGAMAQSPATHLQSSRNASPGIARLLGGEGEMGVNVRAGEIWGDGKSCQNQEPTPCP
jgi:hypothetical protein